MALNLGVLTLNLSANIAGFNKMLTSAQDSLDKFNKSTVNFQQKLEKVERISSDAGESLSLAFTAPLAAAGGAAVKFASDFESAMTESTAIMGDLTTAMRDEMETAAREVAKTSTFSAQETAQAYYFLVSAGLDAAQSIGALPQVTAFAQAGAFGLERATELLADAQSALGLRAQDAAKNLENLTRVSDVLVKANILSNASTEQFSEALTNKAGAALRLLQKDVEEGVAVLATFADQGLKGQEAGEALSIVLRDLQTASIKQREEFERVGISVFDSSGKMRNMADIIADLESAIGGMSDEQRRATFTTLGFQDQSVQALMTLIGTSDAIRRYETELRKAGGTTSEVAQKQLQSLKAQLTLVKNQFVDAALTIGEALLPIIRENLVPALKNFAQSLSNLAKEFKALDKDTQTTIVRIAAYVAALGPALFVTGKFMETIKNVTPLFRLFTGGLSLLIGFLNTATFALSAWRGGAATFGEAIGMMFSGVVKAGKAFAAFAFSGVGLVVIAIAALVVAIILVIKYWDDIKHATLQAWGTIKAVVLGVIASIIEKMAEFVSVFSESFANSMRETAASLRQMEQTERNIMSRRAEVYEKGAQSQAIAENMRQQAMEETLFAERLIQNERAQLATSSAETRVEAEETATKAVVEGTEKQLTALEQMDARIRGARNQWELYQVTTKNTEDSAEFLAEKQRNLQSIVALVQEKVAMLTDQYASARASSGDYAEETVKLADELGNARIELAELNKELSVTERNIALMTAQFTKNLATLDDKIEAAGHSWKLYQANTDAAADSAEYLTAQKAHLQAMIDLVTQKVKLLEDQYGRTRTMSGEYATETVELSNQLSAAQLEVAQLGQELRKTDVSLQLVTGRVKEAKDALDAAKKATDETAEFVDKLKRRLDAAEDALKDTADAIKELEKDTKDAESGISDAFSAMKGHIKEVEDEISEAKRELKDMSKIKLEGEGAIDKELEELSLEEAKVRLAINELKRKGRKGKDTELLEQEKKLEELQLRREKIELERTINVDPLRRELERLAEDTREMTFDEAKAEIESLKTRISSLTTKKEELIAEYDKLRATVIHLIPSLERSELSFEEAVTAVNEYRQRIIDNAAELEKLRETEAKQKETVDFLTDALQQYEDQLVTLTEKQKEAADALDTLTKAIKEAAQATGKPAAPPTAPAPQARPGPGQVPQSVKAPGMQIIGGDIVDTRILGGKLAERLRSAADVLREPTPLPTRKSGAIQLIGGDLVDTRILGGKIAERLRGFVGNVGAAMNVMTGTTAPAAGAAVAGTVTDGVVAPTLDITVKIGNRELEDVVVEAQESARRRGRQ